MRAALVGLASAAVLAISPEVHAQVGQTLTRGTPIQISGRSNGQAFTYSFLLDHFEARDSRVFAVGALSGGNLGQAGQVAIPLRNGNRGRGVRSGPGGGDDAIRGGFGALEHGGSLTQPALFKGSTQSSLFQSDVTPLIIPAQATCPVLDLVLAAVRVNVLGLVIDLNEVVLNLAAQPGALLGDLLCAVLGLLNGLNLTAVAGAVADLLNAVVAALAGLGL
ncbi:MAG: hypothetical protein ACJ79Y_04410 [Myxococcales bacterium]